MDILIEKLSSNNMKSFLDFFDHSAFCDNPDWSGCYCRFFYFSDEDQWEAVSAEQNRADASEAVLSGKMNGYLAFSDKRAVGWCNADNISNYPRIAGDDDIPAEPGKKKAVVVCFVIDPKYRKKGIARKLLNRSCADFRDAGYDYIEAYPRKDADDAGNYHGPISMYISAGFEIIKDAADFYIVRKYLQRS